MYAPSKRGMGAACNWTDDFGNCITPGPSDVIVTPSGQRIGANASGGYGSKCTGGTKGCISIFESYPMYIVGGAALLLMAMLGRGR